MSFVPYANVLTLRGCPFQYVSCSQDTTHGRRSLDRVIEDLKTAVEGQGVQHIILMDETMTPNRNLMLELCQLIRDGKLKFTFEG
jgi:hypothetical protein